MQRASNYSVVFSSEGPPLEQDSFTCFHCSRVVFIQVKQKPEDIGGVCKLCMQLVCPECVGKGVCDPFEKKLEREEARARMLSSIGV